MTRIAELVWGTIYEFAAPFEDLAGVAIPAGERLTFRGSGWSPHDGAHVVRSDGPAIVVHPADEARFVALLRAVSAEPPLISMSIAELRPGVVYAVMDSFIESNPGGSARPGLFAQGERLTYVDQAFDAANDAHLIRFRERTLTLFRGHDVAREAQRYLKAVEPDPAR